jgi:PAS domain S-box-containing protein
MQDSGRAAAGHYAAARASSDSTGDAALSVELLRGMVAANPVGLALFDRELRYVTVNEALAAINGLPVESHIGRTPMELLPGLPPESYEAHFRDVLDGTVELLRTEVSGDTPAAPGVIRHWEEFFYPVRGATGEIEGVGVVAVEVTDQRHAQDALRESEATWRLILDSVPSGLLLVDREGCVRAANTECARLFGYEAEELVGQAVEILLPQGLRKDHETPRQAYSEDPSTRLMGHGRDLRGRRRDGSEFPVEVGLAVAPGVPGLVTCVVTDISARKRDEAEKAALLSAERAAGDRLARLQRVTEAGLSQLPMRHLLPELLVRVIDAAGADAAAILLLDDEGSSLRMGAHVGLAEDVASQVRIPLGEGVAGVVARDARPAVVHDIAESAARAAPALEGLRSMLSVPLVVEGIVIGVLEVSAAPVGRFVTADLELLQPLGDRVALAVDRARAFDRSHDIAETLQRSLLPEQLPTLDRASVAVRYMPGAAGTHVGGDWYDVLHPSSAGNVGEHGDGAVVLVIGDVMGRGVRAAAVMGQLRAALRIYVGLGLPLPEVVARLNATVLAMGETEMATALVVRLCTRTGALSWVSAGHLPAVVRQPDGSSRLLDREEGAGIALGVTDTAVYTEASDRVEPGSTLLLYTDGLIERPEDALDEGLDALLRAASAAPPQAQGCCDSVIAAFLPDGQSPDDVALLALNLHPLAVEPLELHVPRTPDGLSSSRARLREWLGRAGATDDEASDLLVAVGEALARGPLDGGSGDLRVELADDRVEVVLRASGSPPPPDGTDRGRGMVLMEAVVNELSISRDGAGAPEEVTLVRRLAAPRRP